MRYFILLSLLFLSLLSGTIFAQNGPTFTFYFDVDSYALKADDIQRFKEFSEKINWDTLVNGIQLEGHTDADASDAYNISLSEKRVQAVKEFLKAQHIDRETQDSWHGEKFPVHNNASPKEKALNRRVVLRLNLVPDVVGEEGDIRDLYALLEQRKQRFCIDPKGDTVIRLEQGTVIYIPENAFGEQAVRCIEFKAKEFYKKSDMIMENLSTTSNGQLLESEGMIYLEASVNGTQIELAPGKELKIFMPTDSIRDDVGIFNGERDAHSDIMNWFSNNATQIEGINTSSILDCIDGGNQASNLSCERCRFFFCRINRFGQMMQGITNSSVRNSNRIYRKCQRALRRRLRNGLPNIESDFQNTTDCDQLDSLFKVYGVDNRQDLFKALNQKKMDQYGVSTLAELRDTLNKIKLLETKNLIEAGTASQQDIQYYMFNSSKLGWINIDAFSKLEGLRRTMNTTMAVNQNSDCKAVFKSVRGILPASLLNTNYAFNNVPMNHPIWMIGMKYINKNIYLSMVETESKPKSDDFKFRKVSLEELQEALKQLDE